MALMLLPFWTDGCIGSMEGLFFEASGTTPYHFLTTSALSKNSSDPVRRLRYEKGEVDKGVEYLKTLGVRYYLAYNPEVVSLADINPDLEKVATSGPWHVYEVQGTELVTPLAMQPVVVEGVNGSDRDSWLEVGTSWFQDQEAWTALPVADGPESWQRITVEPVDGRPSDDRYLAEVAPSTPIEPVPQPAVTVTDVETGDDSISFRVDRVGVPILVRTSYFPNWKVEGAEGPYRAAPNLMVVVPTVERGDAHLRVHRHRDGLLRALRGRAGRARLPLALAPGRHAQAPGPAAARRAPRRSRRRRHRRRRAGRWHGERARCGRPVGAARWG